MYLSQKKVELMIDQLILLPHLVHYSIVDFSAEVLGFLYTEQGTEHYRRHRRLDEAQCGQGNELCARRREGCAEESGGCRRLGQGHGEGR
jgi:hypothetical protein